MHSNTRINNAGLVEYQKKVMQKYDLPRSKKCSLELGIWILKVGYYEATIKF